MVIIAVKVKVVMNAVKMIGDGDEVVVVVVVVVMVWWYGCGGGDLKI